MGGGAKTTSWYCRSGRRAERHGFTLIEILVTVAIFSLAVAVLAAGLRAGARAYRGVLTHERGRAATAQIEARLEEDLRHLCIVSEELPSLTESTGGAGEEQLRFTTISPSSRQRAGLGAVWLEVEYALGEDNSGQSGLLRRERAYVAAGVALGEAAPAELLVADATMASFAYLAAGEIVPRWEDPEKLPEAVIVTVQREKAPTLSATIWTAGGLRGADR